MLLANGGTHHRQRCGGVDDDGWQRGLSERLQRHGERRFSCSDPPCVIAWFNSLGIDLGESGNSVDSLCPGNYYAQVTNASGCIAIDTASVIAPPPIVANVSSTPTSCAGTCDGTATVGPVGGIPPYGYDWIPDPPGGDGTPQATGLCAGVWQVMITDAAGCDTTVSVLILAPQPITSSAAITDISCSGTCDASIVVTASGGTGTYTYDWTPDPSNGDGTNTALDLCAGDWTLVITDTNNCTSSFTYTIVAPVPLTLNASASPSHCGVCDGSASVTIGGGVPLIAVTWTDQGGNTVGSGLSITDLCAGLYTASAIDALGCTAQITVAVTDVDGEALTMTDGFTTCANNCDGQVSVSFTCSAPRAPSNGSTRWAPHLVSTPTR
jgi:hypothetical protein